MRQSHYVRQLLSNLYISRLHFHPLALVTRGTPQYTNYSLTLFQLTTFSSMTVYNTNYLLALLYNGTQYKLLTGSPLAGGTLEGDEDV
jgi:hypothetical protein